jgi:small conductance mechanosensitive channel
MDFTKIFNSSLEIITQAGFKIVAAIILWFVGRWLINLAIRLTARGMRLRQVEPTITSYVSSSIGVLLNIILIVAILGYFGVETSSFAALLAAAGIAIGAAWSGLLAHFAAGIFIIILKPFRVGDFVTGGGITGTVREIGLFVTSIDTPDNVLTIVANNKLFSDNIQNFSANPFRRVDLVAQLNHAVNHQEAARLLKERLANIPNVLSTPAPDVEILEFNLAGPVLAVRPYCNNTHYWQVYFDTNNVIREAFGSAGFPTPEHHYFVRRAGEAA